MALRSRRRSSRDFPPKVLEDGSVVVSPAQVKLHRWSEGLAFYVGVPMLGWIATRPRKLNTVEKLGLGALAVGTLVVDGYLSKRYRSAHKRRDEDSEAPTT